MKVLSIGYEKELFKKDSTSWKRHVEYAKKVDEYHAIVFTRKESGFEKTEISENCWSYPTGSKNKIGAFADAYRLGKKILKEKGEWVISAQDPFETGLVSYLLSRATGAPFLVQEHGDFFSESYWREETLGNRLRYRLGLFILARANHIRAVSARIRDTLTTLGVNKENITVTHVYTDIESFSNVSTDTSTQSLTEENEILILTMGRFVSQKNLGLLIHAFENILKRGLRAKLLIVGNGPLEEELKKYAKGISGTHIIFKDWVENSSGVMKAADIYALSSNYEGWGRVCVETLAVGTPLLMTDVGCAGELVIDGHDGLVVPIGDEWAFTEGLQRLATDKELRERLAQGGKETIAKMPTFERNVELYIESLKKTLNNS